MSDPTGDVSHYRVAPAIARVGDMAAHLALDIAGLTVRYGHTLAVDGLDLVVPAGQTVALLGPNGAGKSTIVNAVLGLLRPVTLAVRILGRAPENAVGATAAGAVRILGRAPADAVGAGSVSAMLQPDGLTSEARVDVVLSLVRRSYPTS